LSQLRALCEAADSDAFSPVSREEISDQRTPAFMLELSSIWQGVTDLGVSRGILVTRGTLPQASFERVGRYAYLASRPDEDRHAGAWFGVHFRLWKKHGVSPLWAVFAPTEWGQAELVKAACEPWAAREGVFTAIDTDGSFIVALDIPPSEERDTVIEAVLALLDSMRQCWSARSSSAHE
jgi:hypothetical protein